MYTEPKPTMWDFKLDLNLLADLKGERDIDCHAPFAKIVAATETVDGTPVGIREHLHPDINWQSPKLSRVSHERLCDRGAWG